jgi:hypothetical protein
MSDGQVGMALAGKYSFRKYLPNHIATLSKALESVSTNLSLAALLGLALIPLLPNHAGSTFTADPAPPTPAAVTAAPAPVSAPIEVVRAKPVLVPDTPLQVEAALKPPAPDKVLRDPAAAPAPAAGSPLSVFNRFRRRQGAAKQPAPPPAQAKQESGELGKSAANAPASNAPPPPAAKAPFTPVPESKTDTAKADTKTEPPEPATWSDGEVIAALRDCLKRLAPLGAEIEIAPPMRQEACGSPAPVSLKRVGSGSNRVEFQPAPTVNCAMVVGLHNWVEKTLQPAAQEVLGTTITRIRGASGYACRNRNGSRTHSDRLSEHALANAVDIMGFVTADGRTIDVESKWGPNARMLREQQERAAEATALAKKAEDEAKVVARQAERDAAEAARAVKRLRGPKLEQAKADAARKKEEADRKREEAEQKEADRLRKSLQTAELQKLGRGIDVKPDARNPRAVPTVSTKTANVPGLPSESIFLRRLHKGACGTFGTVLGPDANEAHRNHFHFDMAARKRNAFCE